MAQSESIQKDFLKILLCLLYCSLCMLVQAHTLNITVQQFCPNVAKWFYCTDSNITVFFKTIYSAYSLAHPHILLQLMSIVVHILSLVCDSHITNVLFSLLDSHDISRNNFSFLSRVSVCRQSQNALPTVEATCIICLKEKVKG